MGKPPNAACGPAPPKSSYPGTWRLECGAACWPPGMGPVDVWDNCLAGPGICVWSVYHLSCEDPDPVTRICWYGYSLRFSDCASLSPAEANYVNDIPRTVLYEYNMIGHPAFWKSFMNNIDKKPVFRYCNLETPCNIKIKIDPDYF